MSWNLNEFLDLLKVVEDAHGNEQLELLKPSIYSINERINFAQFHLSEFSNAENSLVDGPQDLRGAMFAILKPTEKHSNLRFRARANAVASLQSLHSILDIFSHVIYYALAMNKDQSFLLKERDITIDNIVKKLNKFPCWSVLSLLLSNLNKNENILHLAALVNHSKHRSIIRAPLSLTFSEDYFFGHKFVSFEYKDKLFFETRAEEFIKNVYELIERTLVDSGRELVRFLNLSASKS